MKSCSFLAKYLNVWYFLNIVILLATNFKVRLMEIQQRETQGLSEDRAQAIFSVFDEVLPQLGVYQQVVRMVRDELFGE